MKEKKYYQKLDIIRILSCILILLYHLNLIRGGFLAVCTFFVLSGYLECVSVIQQKKFSIKEYYKKRFQKLYIPLLVVVGMTVIVYKFTSVVWLNLKPEVFSSLLGYNNFWQLKADLNYFTKVVSSPFVHLWFLSILMQFDLVFPLGVILFRKIDKKCHFSLSTLLLFLLLVGSTSLFWWMSQTKEIMVIYYHTLARVFSILWGVFLAVIYHRYSFRFSHIFKRCNTEIFIIYMTILCSICYFLPDNPKYYASHLLIVTILSCRMIAYASIKESKRENRFLSFFSNISYAVYLVQYPILFFVQNMGLSNLLRIILTILCTFILSSILYFVLYKGGKAFRKLKMILLLLLVIAMSFIVITEKDHSKEMAQLEDKLNENLKIIEKKKQEYVHTVRDEEKEWKALLEKYDQEESKVVEEQVKSLSVVGVGDSVFLDAVPKLYTVFPNGYFDGKVSRSIVGGMSLLNDLKISGKLGNTVVLGLSTNGFYNDTRNHQLMDLLGDREVFWINAVGADDPSFNEKFLNFAKNYSNIHIVDWEVASKGHSEYFYVDGIHPKGSGVSVYVNTIYDTIYQFYLEKYRTKKQEMIKEKEEEAKKKIAFYGNDALTNSFSLLQDSYLNALFNVGEDYTYQKLYDEIKDKVDQNILEHRIVFLFDKSTSFTDEEYLKIIELCNNHELYICNITGRDYSFLEKSVTIIPFYDEIVMHDDYLMADKVHLSELGNQELVSFISSIIH